MKVQIVGVGVVGTAQAYLGMQLGHQIYGYVHTKTDSNYAIMVRELVKDADITFICTPEGAVPSVIANLVENKIGGLYVIKSTVPSGTTKSLMEKHQIHICHNPEFLREKTPLEDVIHPAVEVIGQCCAEHGNLLKKYYQPLGVPIMVSVPTLTETVKLTLNAYLSTLITFWNEIDKLAKTLGINTAELASIVKKNPRVSAYGTEFFGLPFGGKCLPKDMDQIINVYQKLGVDDSVFEAMREFNKRI